MLRGSKIPYFKTRKPDPNPTKITRTRQEPEGINPNPTRTREAIPEPDPNPTFATRTHHYSCLKWKSRLLFWQLLLFSCKVLLKKIKVKNWIKFWNWNSKILISKNRFLDLLQTMKVMFQTCQRVRIQFTHFPPLREAQLEKSVV